MKIVLTFCIAGLLMILVVGCKKYNNPANTNNITDPVASVVSSGTWTVSSYMQRTENKTSDFNGINFVFSSDGKLNATGSNTASGSWSSSPATAGYFGGPPSAATFTINLGANTPFNRLSKAWNVAEQSSTLLKLDNPEPVEDEHVALIKK